MRKLSLLSDGRAIQKLLRQSPDDNKCITIIRPCQAVFLCYTNCAMTDKDDGARNANDAAIGAPAVSETKPKDSASSQPATEADLEQVKKQMSGFERSTLRWTRASFFIILATGVFIALQWHEMRVGGIDTHTLAEAAKQSADTAADSFKMEKRRAEDMEEAICRVQGGGTAARDNIFPVQIINNGKVSARNVEAHIEISLRAIPSNQKIRTLATLTISANEIPKEKDEARRLNLPLSSHDWDNIADTKEMIVQSGTLKYENGFDRINNETVCDFWLYFRAPEDKLNPIQGRGATCGRLPELLRSFAPKQKQ